MQALLDALHSGRLIELPTNRKDDALQLLAHLIEAVPDQPVGVDVVAAVRAREQTGNTGLGMEWACPHARIPGEGDLLCAIGWSPVGIDYGAADGRAVRMVIMYLVPENQRNTYLKEVSMLAKSLTSDERFQHLESATDLNAVRLRLIDLVGSALEASGPDARARMIRLESRQASTPSTPAAQTAPLLANAVILPLSVVVVPGVKSVVLALDRALVAALDNVPDLAGTLNRQGQVDTGGFRVLLRGHTTFAADRTLYDCLAIKSDSVAKPATPAPSPAAGLPPR
jgi:mannitol/fructose-specific phosphotransferase system IIA component (Ntr-type)